MRNRETYFGRYIGNMLDQCIWAGITGRDAAVLSDYIIRAGPGDYVEIGTATGASAILVALTKRIFRIPGEVYCIDNFGFEFNPRGTTPEKVMENAKIFGVDDMIHLYVANSHPWPLGEKTFVFGLIDGAHRGLTPTKDFINMSKKVTDYIMFDDIGFVSHPAIAMLVSRVREKGEWIPVKSTDKIVIFKRKST